METTKFKLRVIYLQGDNFVRTYSNLTRLIIALTSVVSYCCA